MKKFKKTICLDFDGVLHSYTSGWMGAHVIPDQPVPGAIDAIMSYIDAGFDVAIYSSRSKSLRGRWAMKRWLERAIADHWQNGGRLISNFECGSWGEATEVISYISWPWFKPAAFLTIDDRAVCFDGIFPSPKQIEEFRPWNKR